MNGHFSRELLIAGENILVKDLSFTDFLSRYDSLLLEHSLSDNMEEKIYSLLTKILRATSLERSTSPQNTPITRVRYLESRNSYLESEIIALNTENSKLKNYEARAIGKAIQCLPYLTESALKIQSIWRGFRLRKTFPALVADIKWKKKLKKTCPAEDILISVKNALSKRSLTLENCYRACDIDNDGVVTGEELRNFLEKLKISVEKRQILKLIEVLDENCSGIIERDELYECLDAYGISSEYHIGKINTLSARALQKFIDKCKNLNGIIDFFRECSSGEEITTEELRKYLKKHIKLLDREVHVLVGILDPDCSGIIKYSTYVSILERKFTARETSVGVVKDQRASNVRSMKNPTEKSTATADLQKASTNKFIQVLKMYSLDPLGILRFTDKSNSDNISRDDYIKGLKKLIPNLGSHINDDEVIELLPENISKQTIQSIFFSEDEDENTQENDYWVKRFNIMIQKKGLNLQMIFMAADSDKDGLISVKDLKDSLFVILDKEISQSEIQLLVHSYGFDDQKQYNFKAFYNIIKSL